MTLSMATTKLAIQKQSFDRQAQLEKDANRSHADTGILTADKSAALVGDDKLMRVCEVRTHGLWELTSTQLWRNLEGGHCWNLPRWTPGGHMQINTTDCLSNIHLDFGHRTFGIIDVALPKHVSAHPLPLKVRCFETGTDVFVGVTFLVGGFVKVHIPALAIVQVDSGCNIVALMKNVVKLAGVCNGNTA